MQTITPPDIKPAGMSRVRAMEIAMAAVLGGSVDKVTVHDRDYVDAEAAEQFDDRVRELIGYKGLTIGQAARELHVSNAKVSARVKALQLVTLTNRGHVSTRGRTHDQQQRIRQSLLDMHDQGATDRDIGKALGLSPSAVQRRRERLGLPRNRVNPDAKYERVTGEQSVALDKRIAELHGEGLDDRAIAERVEGTTREGVRRRRIKLGLVSHNPAGMPLKVETRDTIAALVEQGFTDAIIAKRLDMTRERVATTRHKYGIPCNPMAPTSHRDRDVMAALVDEGLTAYQIGRRLGINKSTAGNWVLIHGLTLHKARK
jgi:DNA-binding CsgD family transcriptional regulator